MPTDRFVFANREGALLEGRLERPAGPVRAYALFAHCFTCGKDSLAAVRIARRLTAAGVAVLRFDFTGVGASEGDFAAAGFTQNIADLLAAAAAMAEAGRPVELLIGHSLGGAAVIAAAGHLPEVRAVATIGAPFDVAHVLKRIGDDKLAEIAAQGSAEVELGARWFTIARSMVEDMADQDQAARIASLHRPLLLLHSPTDASVGIDNVSAIYLAARHPKSFVSLDGADHLLSSPADAEFAADMIAAWAGRYLPSRNLVPDAGDADAEETGLGKFQVTIRAGGASFVADEPVSVGGLASGPSPYDLLSAGLAACTTMTMRLYALGKGWNVARLRTSVSHSRDPLASPPDHFARTIVFPDDATAEQRAKLLDIAERCPVHRTLARGARLAPAIAFEDAGVNLPPMALSTGDVR